MIDLKRAFDTYDRDHSGFIEFKELEPLVIALGGGNRNDEGLLVALSKLKPAKPGKISFAELEKWWLDHGDEIGTIKAPSRTAPTAVKRSAPPPTERDAQEIFNGFDQDQSGQIDTKELAKLLEALGTEPDDDDVAQAMQRLDKDKSGRISWEEFRVWWAQQ